MKLTSTQWAIVLALKHQPDYRFVGNERVAAQRMVNSGLLRWVGLRGCAAVTVQGWKAYARTLSFSS